MAGGSSDSLRLEQQLRQQQRLNPQSVALGRVLEMTGPEFEDEVRRELDDNPALEEVEHVGDRQDSFAESAEQLQMADYASEDDAPAYLRQAFNRSADDAHTEAASFAADDGLSAGELLMRRLLDDHDLDTSQMAIARHIIGNLDSNGYMTRSLTAIADDLAIAEGIEVSEADVRKVFDAVRSLDPPGIGAVDLRDCLLLQLRRLPSSPRRDDALLIVNDFFDIFSRKHFDRLQLAAGLTRDRLEDALDLIRTLNPKPASVLDTGSGVDRAAHVTPDFVLDYDAEADSFTLSLTGRIPELAVEASFSADPVGDDTRQHRAGAFIRRKRDEALQFMRLVELRGQTLLAIGQAIVNHQRHFFISGDRADIRPMILRDIADTTGLDLSVISRATSGKYILTPHGIYPLKMFFNERPDADTDMSSHAVLEALRQILDTEDKRHPLSDRRLHEILAEKGLDIARRTVAKYREKLGVPVARLRKIF